jgi:hypothetical protein
MPSPGSNRVIWPSGDRVIETQVPGGFLMTRSSDDPIDSAACYRAAIPLGPAGLVTVIGLLIEPVVVLNVKPEMLLWLLFDV